MIYVGKGKQGKEILTLFSSALTFKISDPFSGMTKLDNIKVIKSDYTTLNGVFHEVDGILS